MLVSGKQHLIRQWDIIPSGALATPVTIIGAGAIGSWAALSLAKMGVTNITVYDHDVVGIENVSCQLYGSRHIGQPKVEALKEIILGLTALEAGLNITAINAKWSPAPETTKGIVILAVDSMETRKAIFKELVNGHFLASWLIDCRMGAETALMYTMEIHSEKDRTAYSKTLYSDSDSVQEPCTGRATGYTAGLLSNWAVKAFKDIITKNNYPRVTLWNISGSSQQVFQK